MAGMACTSCTACLPALAQPWWTTGQLLAMHVCLDLPGLAAAGASAGRILNIAVTAADTQEPCRLLNYLTGPWVHLVCVACARPALALLC